MGDWDGRNNLDTRLTCTNRGSETVPVTLYIRNSAKTQLAKKALAFKVGSTRSVSIVKSTRSRKVARIRHYAGEGNSGAFFLEPRTNRDPANFKLDCIAIQTSLSGVVVAGSQSKPVTKISELSVVASAYSTSATNSFTDTALALTAEGGNWLTRWGPSYTSFLEPPIHPVGVDNYRSARLIAQSLNASALQFASGNPGTTLRNADVSFRANMGTFNHILSAAAYDSASIGRIGTAVFRDKMFIQFNRTEYPTASNPGTCNRPDVPPGTNVFPPNGVALPRALKGNRWYRVNSQIRLTSAGLEIKGILQDLENGAAIVQSVTEYFPASCIPSWYNSSSNSFAVGFMGESAGANMYLDDFVGRPTR
jgi:hypothetical protein